MRNDGFLWVCCVGLMVMLVALSMYHINGNYRLRQELAELELVAIEQKHRLKTLENTNHVLMEAFECQELRRQLGTIYDK